MRAFLFSALVVGLLGCGSSKQQPATAAPTSTSPFVAEAVEGLGDPELVVANDSDVTFTIVLQGPTPNTFEVPAHGKHTVRIKPGKYSYSGGSPNILPVEGEHEFASDMRYSWRFFVIIKRSDDPAFVGKGWACFEVQAKPDFLICARNQGTCEKARATMDKPGNPKTSACTAFKVVYGFSDTAEDLPLYGNTMAQCEQVRAEYMKQAKDAAKVTACSEQL